MVGIQEGYGWQVGSTHATGMLSCTRNYRKIRLGNYGIDFTIPLIRVFRIK